MNKRLKSKLVAIAKTHIHNDLSHDFGHAYRVMNLATRIAISENADLDIVIPAALFHDVFVYKGSSKYKMEHVQSANFAKRALLKIEEYPKEKIEKVAYSIMVCSFSKNIRPKLLEAKVLQDADLLESTGAISIMRTFGSSTPMHITAYYDLKDPFCYGRKPNDRKYSLDLFFTRLLKVSSRMHTKAARRLAMHRNTFLRSFIKELYTETKE